MMWFVIFAEDHENSLEARKQARPDHLARLNALQQDGRLLVAGPALPLPRKIPAYWALPAQS